MDAANRASGEGETGAADRRLPSKLIIDTAPDNNSETTSSASIRRVPFTGPHLYREYLLRTTEYRRDQPCVQNSRAPQEI